MSETNPFLTFSDADLQATMRRAMRVTVALTVILFGMMVFVWGWKSGVMFLAGAVVSMTGLYEWQQLIVIINGKLDKQKTPRSTAFVLAMFLLRLGLAGAIIYGTLRCLHGSLYALLGGLGLAVVALTIETLRLVRS